MVLLPNLRSKAILVAVLHIFQLYALFLLHITSVIYTRKERTSYIKGFPLYIHIHKVLQIGIHSQDTTSG